MADWILAGSGRYGGSIPAAARGNYSSPWVVTACRFREVKVLLVFLRRESEDQRMRRAARRWVTYSITPLPLAFARALNFDETRLSHAWSSNRLGWAWSFVIFKRRDFHRSAGLCRTVKRFDDSHIL